MAASCQRGSDFSFRSLDCQNLYCSWPHIIGRVTIDYSFLTKHPFDWLVGAGACLKTDEVLCIIEYRQGIDFKGGLGNC